MKKPKIIQRVKDRIHEQVVVPQEREVIGKVITLIVCAFLLLVALFARPNTPAPGVA